MPWIFITITAAMDMISSVLIKEWTLHHRFTHFALGILALCVSGVSFGLSMRYFGLAISNILWNSFSTLFLTFIAIAFFHEKLSSIQLFGVFIVIIGVILVGK